MINSDWMDKNLMIDKNMLLNHINEKSETLIMMTHELNLLKDNYAKVVVATRRTGTECDISFLLDFVAVWQEQPLKITKRKKYRYSNSYEMFMSFIKEHLFKNTWDYITFPKNERGISLLQIGCNRVIDIRFYYDKQLFRVEFPNFKTITTFEDAINYSDYKLYAINGCLHKELAHYDTVEELGERLECLMIEYVNKKGE